MPEDYEEDSPSAAERFRKSISAVSSSVLKKVRNIPRRAWRIAVLALGAVFVILFIVWSISKLYSATAVPAADSPRETTPADTALAEPAKQSARPETPPAPKTQTPTAKPKPGKLISTGQAIPDLYMDD